MCFRFDCGVPLPTHPDAEARISESEVSVIFQVGEKVIYPNHGIGIVESIQTRPTPTGKISLYQLRILAGEAEVKIFGEYVAVKAQVSHLEGFSGHADADEELEAQTEAFGMEMMVSTCAASSL